MTFLRLTPAQYQRAIHEIFGPSIQVDHGTTVLGSATGGCWPWERGGAP